MRGVVKQSLAVAGTQTQSDDFMRLRWVMCRMAGLPEFLSLTNHQSDDLFCLPFNISLQRGQCPSIFLAESIKEKRQCQMGDPVEIECENQPPVYEGLTIPWIFSHRPRFLNWPGIKWLRPG